MRNAVPLTRAIDIKIVGEGSTLPKTFPNKREGFFVQKIFIAYYRKL